jgi:hypothetical protein
MITLTPCPAGATPLRPDAGSYRHIPSAQPGPRLAGPRHHHITASPSKIGDIARAALVLTHFEHGYIT